VFQPGQRFLTVYSGILTAVFAGVVLSGAGPSRVRRFNRLEVRRNPGDTEK